MDTNFVQPRTGQGFPVASGRVDRSGIEIPKKYANSLIIKWYADTNLTVVANTDYEKDIATEGDTVWIRTTPDIIIHDYQKGQDLVTQTPAADVKSLIVDEGKYFQFQTELLDERQADYSLSSDWMGEGMRAMDIEITRSIFNDAPALAAPENQGAKAGKINRAFYLGTPTNPLYLAPKDATAFLTNCCTVLNDQNLPNEDRYFMAPTGLQNILHKDILSQADHIGDSQSIIRSGGIGMAEHFNIYESTLLKNGTVAATALRDLKGTALSTELQTSLNNSFGSGNIRYYEAFFGLPLGISFAAQIASHVEGPITQERGFGRLYRALSVYGWEVLQPEAFGRAVIALDVNADRSAS